MNDNQKEQKYPSCACKEYEKCDSFWWYGDHCTPFHCDTSKCHAFKLREDYKPLDVKNENKNI